MMKRVLSFLFCFSLVHIVYAQTPIDLLKKINGMRDDVYLKLQEKKINTQEANKIYDKLQTDLFKNKNYPEYIELFIYKAVDFYVTENNFEKASAEIQKGLEALKYVKGTSYDTLYFKLNLEISAYSLRIPSQINQAEKYFKNGYDFLKKHAWLEQKMPSYVITFLSNYGRMVDELGDSEQSFNYYQQALKIANEQNIKLNKYALLTNLAKYFREKKDYKNALKLLKEALLTTESDDKTAVVYLGIGKCYNQMKQYDDALKAFAEAQKFYTSSKELQPRLLVNIQNNQADAYLGLKQLNKAENLFQKSLSDFQKYFTEQKSVQIAHIYNGLSEIHEQKSDNKKALAYVENVASAPSFSIAPQEYFIALVQKADLLSVSNPELSVETLISAIRFAVRLRKSFDMPESKLFYSEKVYPIYETTLEKTYQLWQKTHQKQWAEKFFYVLETSKSATLWDVVKEQQIRPKTLNDSLLNVEAKLRQKIVKLQIRILESGDEKAAADLSSAKIQLNHLVKDIEKQSKNYYELKYSDRLISLAETQQKLPKQTTFISYFLGENALYYLASNQSSFEIIKIQNVAHCRNTIQNLYKIISTPPGIDAYKGHLYAKNLYDFLIKPIEKLTETSKRLIIARHDILGYIPFEVIEKQGHSDYLVFQKIISYANSATLHFDFDITQKPTADIIAYAPFSNGQKVGKFRDKGFKALPASVTEIGTINGEIFQDDKATKLNFEESYRNKGIIHFATHAQVDDSQPEKSFIALYPDGEDFKLYTPELYNLSLENTQLVVLSACETGKGAIRRGEGIMSLARAFQFAGCPSVITTIWNAHDESMAKLSKSFYKYLEDDKPTDEALQLAKISLLRSNEHPFYWANFVLVGKNAQLSIHSSTAFYWISAFLIAAVLLYFLRKRIFPRLFK